MSGEASAWKGWQTSFQQTKDGALQVLKDKDKEKYKDKYKDKYKGWQTSSQQTADGAVQVLIFGNMVVPLERQRQRQIQRQGMADPVSHGALQVLKRTAKKNNRTI